MAAAILSFLRRRLWPALRDAPLKLTVLGAVLLAALGWQVWTAPPWQVGKPPSATGYDVLAADGTVLAHRGPKSPAPINAERLPAHVRQAFIAIEDRRFEDHGGVDLRGLARAIIANLRAGGVVEGGSTITQQYVKNAYLTHDRNMGRKVRELFLADWVETWLTKNEILSRYLERIYFGEGQTGLTAAARHYFGRDPAQLDLGQAAMLAGLVKAPSKLSPIEDRAAARERMGVVLNAMADAGFITPAQARAVRNPVLSSRLRREDRDRAGWFVDWVTRELPGSHRETVRTTLEPDLQERAERVVAGAPLGGAQIALVAMRPDGQVVAMVGGKRWQPRAFNRVTQAKRQAGSTFKLFDYLAALRDGATPDDVVLDAPIAIGDWRPTNGYEGYRGPITVAEAFGVSSNTAAIRVAQTAGYDEVIRAARDLGIEGELSDEPSLPLGTASLSLLDLTEAYAAFAGGRYPVVARGIAGPQQVPANALDREREWAPMLTLLWGSANLGTGSRAALSQPTFGKTGTSQDGRDSLFIGFAGDLVTAVWIGRDDNAPISGASGGRLPAEIWRAFMSGAKLRSLGAPVAAPARLASAGQQEPVRAEAQRYQGRERGRGKRGKGKKR